MYFSRSHSAILASVLAASSVSVNGLNILITNDDGFGASNIREMYKAVKAYGHNAYIVASTSNESGTGGTVVYTTEAKLTADTEFGLVKAGAPSVGTDPINSHIWYYNGTPSACVQVALDYVFPNFTNITTPDLVLAGPNFGWNLGPFLYTLSGTVGATYTAIERGIPAIAFSAGYSIQTGYKSINATTTAGLKDPATYAGQLAADLAQQLINNTPASSPLLPLGYGISVNIPYITSYTDSSCIAPPFIKTRQTGGADVDRAIYNATTGLFSYGNIVSSGANVCINGDCSLPGETLVLNAGCYTSVSVFTVDYDAPLSGTCSGQESNVLASLSPLVKSWNGTSLSGGSAPNTTATSSSVGTKSTGVASITGINGAAGEFGKGSWIAGMVGILGFAVLNL